MDYARVLRLPQYFRNLQRLSEIVGVLVKHGFGDLVDRLHLSSYVSGRFRLFYPAREPVPALDFHKRLRLVCQELGPTFIKFAQVLATRPDILPEIVTAELRLLQDDVAPFPASLARARVEKQLRRPIGEVFSRFDDRPLAAASIAQVHRATLLDGTEVVVKIQRPGIDRVIESDLNILRGIATLIEDNLPETLAFHPTQLVEEFARSLSFELDFRREAANIARFRENFRSEAGLVVPRVYEQFSTAIIITEEFIDGLKADDAEAARNAGMDGKEMASLLARVVLKSIFEYRFFHADPHPGNVLLLRSGRIAMIDFGAMGRLDAQRVQQVLSIILAILSKDFDRMLSILQDHQIAPLYVDEVLLKNQVGEILDQYENKKLGKLDLVSLLTEVFEVVRQHGIRPPPDLLLVGKSLTAIEYIASRLDPEFDPIATIHPYLLRCYMRMTYDPAAHSAQLLAVMGSYKKLLSDLPRDLRLTLRHLARGDLVVQSSNRDFVELKAHQNRMLNRALSTLVGIAFVAFGIQVAQSSGGVLDPRFSYVFLALGIYVLATAWLAVFRNGGRF